MKYLAFFESYINNLSKKRKFPTYGETMDSKGSHSNITDFYSIYNLPKNKIGDYLNTWFDGEKTEFKNNLGTFIANDEKWTVKRTDDETSNKLYNRKINPIKISIHCPTGARKSIAKNSKGELLYNMIASIKSIDDSSFTTWFISKPIPELEEIRIKLMKWINLQPIINGFEFIKKCEEMGADKDQTNFD